MDCPKCHERLLCDYCSRSSAYNIFRSPGCQTCKIRYEKEIDDAKMKLATLRVSLTTKFAEQQSAYKQAQSRLSERLAFLKLQDPDPSMEIFKGDVAFVVHGCDKIHAHRFILEEWLLLDDTGLEVHNLLRCFYRLESHLYFAECSTVGCWRGETGLIPIDDASYPVMRAVVDYCYRANINFTDEVPPDEVLKVAHKYDIAHLKHVCEEELCRRIGEENVAEMLRLSKSHEAKSLQEASVKYFKEHFDAVISTVLELDL